MPGGSLWKEPLGTVGGKKRSLDDIEHTMVRQSGLANQAGVAGRIHTAFVCASLSCPDLQTTAFEANTIVAEVTLLTERWLANPTKNPGPQGGNTVSLSSIFMWYGGDFAQESQSIPAFLRTYSPWPDEQLPNQVSIVYSDYNWNLNGYNVTKYTGAANSAMNTMSALLLCSLAFAAMWQ
jgi:hypothetical protein